MNGEEMVKNCMFGQILFYPQTVAVILGKRSDNDFNILHIGFPYLGGIKYWYRN